MSASPRSRMLIYIVFSASVAFAGPESDRQAGDDAWNRAVNTKIPKASGPAVAAWFCQKCNQPNAVQARTCKKCGFDPAGKPAPTTNPKPAGAKPARPVFTPGQPTPIAPSPINSTPVSPSPIQSWLETGVPAPAQPKSPGARLPGNTISADKEKAESLLTGPTKPMPARGSSDAKSKFAHGAKTSLTEADRNRARDLQRTIDAANAKGGPFASEDADAVYRAKARRLDLLQRALDADNLEAEDYEQIKPKLHTAPDEQARQIPDPALTPRLFDAPPRPNMNTPAPPPPQITPTEPTAWERYKEDAATVGGFVGENARNAGNAAANFAKDSATVGGFIYEDPHHAAAKFMEWTRASLKKHQKKFEVRTPTAVLAARA